MGSLRSPPVLLTLAGLLLTPVLVARRVPGALILSIAALTLIGLFVPGANGKMVTSVPSAIMSWPRWPTSTFMALDVGYLFTHFLVALPLLFYFLCAEFFSTLGTLIGVTGAANLRRPDGSIPNATAAFATDATATIVGPLLGTSVVTAYIESITGVQAGGRTGLTSLTVAAFFCLALFFWPIFVIIPPQATAPALVLVGVLMMQGLARIDMTDLGNAVPDRADAAGDGLDQQPHQRNGAGDAELYRAGSHHGPPVADSRDGLGPGRGVHSLRDRDGADHVKRRDATAPDRHGSIDGPFRRVPSSWVRL